MLFSSDQQSFNFHSSGITVFPHRCFSQMSLIIQGFSSQQLNPNSWSITALILQIQSTVLLIDSLTFITMSSISCSFPPTMLPPHPQGFCILLPLPSLLPVNRLLEIFAQCPNLLCRGLLLFLHPRR